MEAGHVRRALLSVLLTLAASPAAAGQCVFYLKAAPKSALLEGRVFDPESGKDSPAPMARAPSADMLWDPDYERVYWLDGPQIRRAWWKGRGRPLWPVPLPPDLAAPAAWWLDWRGLKLAQRAEDKLLLWEHLPAKRVWRLGERERLLEPAGRERRAEGVLFEWTSRRRDASLKKLLEAMQGTAHLGMIRWTGGPESGAGYFQFLNHRSCGLNVHVQRDAAGAHLVAPVVHWCEKPEPAKPRKPAVYEEEPPYQGRVLFAEPAGGEFAAASFAESDRWLLLGREPGMEDPSVVRLKDGAVLNALGSRASRAVWVPCPR